NWTVNTATSPPTPSLDATTTARPGVSTRNDTVTNSLVSGLSTGQKADIKGLGYVASPPTPSVYTTASASTAEMLKLVSDILAGLPNNGATKLNTINSKSLSNPKYNWGTAAQPLVTELTNDSPNITGNVEGYGILIVDHNVHFGGTMNWYGWV